VIQAWNSKVNTITLLYKNCMHFIRVNFENLRQKMQAIFVNEAPDNYYKPLVFNTMKAFAIF
jgi:hypothetical protein